MTRVLRRHEVLFIIRFNPINQLTVFDRPEGLLCTLGCIEPKPAFAGTGRSSSRRGSAAPDEGGRWKQTAGTSSRATKGRIVARGTLNALEPTRPLRRREREYAASATFLCNCERGQGRHTQAVYSRIL